MMKPETAGSSSLASQASSMASLSQAARKRQLRIARNILIAVGIVKIVFNVFFYGNIEAKAGDAVQCQVQQALRHGRVMQPAEIELAKQNAMLIEVVVWMGAIALGMVFVFLGLFVKQYPVPITVLGLILYLVTTLVFGILNPFSLLELVFKFFALAALSKSIQAAIAYQRAESALETVSIRADGESPGAPATAARRRALPPRERSDRDAASEVDLNLSLTPQTPSSPQATRVQEISLVICTPDTFSFTSLSISALLCGIAACITMVAGMYFGNAHWCIFSIAPWMWAVGNWFFRPKPFHCEMNSDGLLLADSSLIRYAEIQNMRLVMPLRNAVNAWSSGALVLITSEGCVQIPGDTNVPLLFLYRHLISRIPRSGSRELPEGALEHLQQAEAASAPGEVSAYRSRRFTVCGPATGHYQARAALLFLGGLFWLFVGVGWSIFKQNDDYAAWSVCGVLLMILSFLIWWSARSQQGRLKLMPGKYRHAAMIISPAGLFLHQEDLGGFLRWEELRNVVFQAKLKSFAVSSAQSGPLCIDLHVDGAVIRVEDIYDRPLALIHSLIKNYWLSSDRFRKG